MPFLTPFAVFLSPLECDKSPESKQVPVDAAAMKEKSNRGELRTTQDQLKDRNLYPTNLRGIKRI